MQLIVLRDPVTAMKDILAATLFNPTTRGNHMVTDLAIQMVTMTMVIEEVIGMDADSGVGNSKITEGEADMVIDQDTAPLLGDTNFLEDFINRTNYYVFNHLTRKAVLLL